MRFIPLATEASPGNGSDHSPIVVAAGKSAATRIVASEQHEDSRLQPGAELQNCSFEKTISCMPRFLFTSGFASNTFGHESKARKLTTNFPMFVLLTAAILSALEFLSRSTVDTISVRRKLF